MRVSEMAADGPAAKDDEPPLETRVRALGPDLVVSPSQLVARALQLAGVDREDLIDVAGPDGLAAMVALCRARHGLEDKLSAGDIAELDALAPALPARDDLTVHTSRTVWLARKTAG